MMVPLMAAWRQAQTLFPPSESDADKNTLNSMSQYAQPATSAWYY